VSRQGFATKRAAEKAMQAVLQSIGDGTVVQRSKMTVAEFLDDWLSGQRHRLRATTLASYETAALRVRRGLGAVPLQALTPLQIERFYADLADTGGGAKRPLAAKTIRNTHVVLRKALADAERLGLVNRNAASAARPPTTAPSEQTTWSTDELKEFFVAIREHRLYAAFVVLATTGMRRGEVLGLRWADVDLDGDRLAVVQTLVTVGNDPAFSPPKTARSRRLIYLDAQTVAVLREHRRRQRKERLAAGPGWDSESDLVFRDELGRLVHPDWFSREFRRVVDEAEARPIRLHDLRHTYATLALKAGVHPKVVSDRLGHATVGITLDLYSHVTPAVARDAADVVAARIFDG
jgi:integrase